MPSSTASSEGRLEKCTATNEMASLSLRTEEPSLRWEEMRLEYSMGTQHQRENEAEQTEIRRLKEENERLRMQFEEDRKVREHAKEIMILQMEENNKAREHELKPEVQETLKLKLELAKATEILEKLKTTDNRLEREHKERMETFVVERMNSAEEIRRQRKEERQIVTEENQEQIRELSNRCEQLERQRRKEEEQNIRRLRNVGLAATGVGAASGYISGALGSTAAVGVAAGVAGAATVLAPVSAAVAVISGTGYVYRIVTSSNRA